LNAKKKKLNLALMALFASGQLILSTPAMAAAPFVVKDIRVEGLQRVEPGTVFSYLPVKVGETFNDDKGAETIRALFNTGFFKDVRVEVEHGVLVVLVEERPTISRIEYTGMKEFDKDAIAKSLRVVGVGEARYFDKALIDKAEQELKRQYISKGFYDSEIVTTITPGERNRVSVVFNIEEGEVSKISKINIIGNKDFSESMLFDEMLLSEGNWVSWYTKNNLYSKQKLTADLESLRSFYLNRGYLEFAIDSTQVSISPDKKGVYITINIREGEKYTVRDIRLAGELLGKEDEFKSLIPIKKGEVYSSAKLNEGTKAIADILGTYGYAFASINPQPEIRRNEKEVDLTLVVDPGKRAYVRKINVVGNSKTRDTVIRREMRQLESSWYDADKLKLSKDRINRLGYFTEVDLSTQDIPGSNDQVDVNVRVVEKPTGSFTLGAGFSSTEKLVLSAGINQENAFGTGTNIGFNFNTGKLNRTFVLSQFDPYFTDDGISRYSDVYYRTQRPLMYLGDSEYTIVTAGTSLRFGVPYSETGRIFFGMGFERLQITTSDNTPQSYIDYVQQFNPRGTTATTYNLPLTVGWAQDRRDSALIPTKGTFQQANFELSPPVLDLQYYRAYYQHQLFYPLTRSQILSFNGELGYGRSYGDKPFPITKNYYVGGIGSVRGYSPGTLGPQSEYYITDTAGNKTLVKQSLGGSSKLIANIEYTFPVPGAGTDKTLRFFTFFDVGNVYNGNIQLSELRYSYGVGISWISPLGPLKFSYGKPISPKPEDRIQNLQFQIGTAF
jgi:outer membrane protein insertion porin family